MSEISVVMLEHDKIFFSEGHGHSLILFLKNEMLIGIQAISHIE
jgi:hypothetical protein